MQPVNRFLDAVRTYVRAGARRIASLLNRLSGGRLTPNMVTITSLLAHLPIAWLISQGYFGYATLGVLVFGLMDTLDGELARLQKRDSNAGMLLDASTDRMKEVLLYSGVAYVFVLSGNSYYAVWAVAAAGGSLLVSYVKAKGETAARDSSLSANQLNRIFSDGFFRYELRMAVLIAGLLFSQLEVAVVTIAVLAWMTAFERLVKITRQL